MINPLCRMLAIPTLPPVPPVPPLPKRQAAEPLAVAPEPVAVAPKPAAPLPVTTDHGSGEVPAGWNPPAPVAA
jgi:hypothetical protein